MIFTHAIASNGAPDEQGAGSHGLAFSSNMFVLRRADASPPVGMTGFIEADLNESCPYAFMLDLRFSANPTNWQVVMGDSSFFGKATTWNNKQVGALSGQAFTAQPSTAADAVANHHIRLLVPRLAEGISTVRITLGSSEQNTLLSANFHRCIAVLHPSPRAMGRLARRKKTVRGIDGRIHTTSESPDKLYTCRINIPVWESINDLEDLDRLEDLDSFAMFPSGLESISGSDGVQPQWRPSFARNCEVTQSSGIKGADDLAVGPQGISLRIEESA